MSSVTGGNPLDSYEVIAARTMQSLYIWLDLAFLAIFLCLLVWTGRWRPAVAGILGGVLYFVVDYGIFFQLLGTREVHGADPFWFLAWLSMSYGLTNFAWIWLWLERDKRIAEWSVFIVAGWIFVALLSQDLGYDEIPISIARGTAQYHGVMALIMFVGYAYLCYRNMRAGSDEERAPILRLVAVGVLVQLSWETVLAIAGIRDFSWNTLIVNSLIETNLGMPYLFLIHRAVTRGGRSATVAAPASD